MADVAVLLPIRIETRFKGGDLWIRVVPDEPWFLQDDPRITSDELGALGRFAAAPPDTAADGVPIRWRELAAQVGAPRAVHLVRQFVTAAPDGTLTVRSPNPVEVRGEPALPRVAGFPSELVVWISDGSGPARDVLRLAVNRARLLADFADPDVPGDRRWWEDWDEAVAVGVAGIIPAAALTLPIEALYVTGLGDGDPAELFRSLVAEGRVGLLDPGTPTNSVDGAPAAPLGTDPATWWTLLQSPPGDGDRDVSQALTGDPARLGNMPGGERPHRARSSALVSVMWPALWGFAAGQVFDVARGSAPARWAASAMFPEGAYPTIRVGPQPYGLLPTTAWRSWEAAADDPTLEGPLLQALLTLRDRHVQSARGRGTVAGQNTERLLELIADTPTSSAFRYRLGWPLELWWLAMAGSSLPQRWRTLSQGWSNRYRLVDDLGLTPLRRYGARGRSRRIGLPLVLPPGAKPDDLPDLLGKLADTALSNPSAFANTTQLETTVFGRPIASLLGRLAIRSLQLLIGDLRRHSEHVASFDPEPFSRRNGQRGRLEQLIATAEPIDTTQPNAAAQHLIDVAAALRSLGTIPVPELERMLAATIDCSSHRIDPWLVALPQRRLDSLTASGAVTLRLGAYGWVDAPSPGTPGPTPAGLLHAPSPTAALTAAVLRDRAISDSNGRWDLDITSRSARTADRLAEHVRIGAHLAEVVGGEVERIVARGVDIEKLRRDFPVRAEHAGRRVCDGLRILAAQPFPVAVDADQAAALQELRDAIDAYGDLLVAEAVHNLVEGRPEIASAVMDGAAGLNRPPEMSLLRTRREGRAVSSSVLLALPHAAGAPLPAADGDRALLSPAATLDPSFAAWLRSDVGAPSGWNFEISFTIGSEPPQARTVHLSDLRLEPVDALALTRTRLESLLVERAAELEGIDLDVPAVNGAVVGGNGAARYERAATLAGLVRRHPAGARSLSEDPAADPSTDVLDPSVVSRYLAVREVGEALARMLRQQAALFARGEIGTADRAVLRRLVAACAGWGIAPDPPVRAADMLDPPATPAARRLHRLVDSTLTALPQLEERLAASPNAGAAGRLSRVALMDAAAALVSPTRQVAITGAARRDQIPVLERADGEAGLDASWLTVVAAVRPPLAPLEAHQLTATTPLGAWANRPADPWQTDSSDLRRLVAIYAPRPLDFGAMSADTLVAVAAVDRFSEVIPAAEQFTGAAFGFDAPAARPQQAILLAVPPVVTRPLDQEMLVRIISETRELAHARMARPIDIDEQFWGIAPTVFLPASGAAAIPLEVRP